MEDNIIELDNESYDRDRERAMNSDVSMEDKNDALYKETIKLEIEELDIRIGQLEWSIEQDGKTLKKLIEEKKHKETLLEDNNF